MANQRSQLIFRIILALVVVGVLLTVFETRFRGPASRRAMRLVLELSDMPAEQKRRIAWDAAAEPDEAVAIALRYALARCREFEPDVAEPFVYALGYNPGPETTSTLWSVLQVESRGDVRAAAWLALARADASAFRALVGGVPPADDLWERLGRAQAWLLLGDLRGADDLLRAARDGDHGQRVVAARALQKWLAPQLAAAGVWPCRFDPAPGDEWPAELLDLVKQRCAEVRLAALTENCRAAFARNANVLHDVGRIMGARRRLVRLLFGHVSENASDANP